MHVADWAAIARAVLMWTIHMSASYHLISQAGWNRCNLLYCYYFLTAALAAHLSTLNLI